MGNSLNLQKQTEIYSIYKIVQAKQEPQIIKNSFLSFKKMIKL